MSDARPQVPILRLLLAWGIVGIPLVWGVYQTLMKTAVLFQK